MRFADLIPAEFPVPNWMGEILDRHVRHAFEHNLKPGGRLVAVMSESPFFHSGKAAESFRQWFEANGGTSERLPAGSFSQGDVPTGVNTRLVVLNRRQGT